VKQSGGHVTVYSEPAHGTTFRLYFPRVSQDAQPAQHDETPETLARGSGTVLVVEDEDAVRRFVSSVLSESGYTVLECASPREAVSLVEGHEGRIDLLITDVVMPDMNGQALADEVRRQRPSMPVIFISGYTGNGLAQRGLLKEDVKLLTKPFGAPQLSDAVREMLGRRPDSNLSDR